MSRSAILRKAAEDLHLPPGTTWARFWLKVMENMKIGCLATADVVARLADELDGARPMF